MQLHRKVYSLILVGMIFLLGTDNLFAQFGEDIPVSQSDIRFTLIVKKRWLTGAGEEYFFYIKNNTNFEMELTVRVALNLACLGTKSFDLGNMGNRIYIKPNGTTTGQDDGFHMFTEGLNENCILKNGNSRTLFQGISYHISNVINLTLKKEEEKKEKEAQQLATQKQKEEKEWKEAQLLAAQKQKEEESRKAAEKKKQEELVSKQTKGQEIKTGSNGSSENAANISGSPSNSSSDHTGGNSTSSSQPGDQKSFYDNKSSGTGNYASLEERNAQLNAEYEKKYQQQLKDNEISKKQNQKIADDLASGVSEIAGMARGLIADAEREKERKKAKEDSERQLEARQKALALEVRNNISAQYPDGGIPLSSQKMDENVLYFFSYALDESTIRKINPVIYVSNVFPIERFADGSWPFKSIVTDDIARESNTESITLLGYFSSVQQADKMRNNLLETCSKGEFSVQKFNYGGKKATAPGNNKLNFWGDIAEEPNKNTDSSEAISSRAKVSYQEAEAAFGKQDYKTAILKLDEAKKLLGHSNPSILYLRILATDKLIEEYSYPDAYFSDFDKLVALKGNCRKYIVDFKRDGLEDNYTNVRAILEHSSRYSANLDMGKGFASISNGNNKEALEYFKKAETSGDLESLTWIGLLYEIGENGIAQSFNDAFLYYKKAADKGSPLAMTLLGISYLQGNGTAKDYTQAYYWIKSGVSKDIPAALSTLGTMYYHGWGVIQNSAEAFNCHKKAANKGNILSMYFTGLLYEYGKGTELDYDQAMSWFKKAADKGNTDAMLEVGFFYDKGYAVKQNYAEAFRFYKKAAEGGNIVAMNNMGIYFRDGFSVTQNYTEAMNWFSKSAEKGSAAAMQNIAALYQNGWGVEKDKKLAKDWREKAKAEELKNKK